MKLPKNVKTLMAIDKFEVKGLGFITTKKDAVKVIAKDGREYVIFKNKKQAKAYATNLVLQYEDSPKLRERLGWADMSVEDYAKSRVKTNGATSYISYDQYHKIELKNGAIAYRTI